MTANDYLKFRLERLTPEHHALLDLNDPAVREFTLALWSRQYYAERAALVDDLAQALRDAIRHLKTAHEPDAALLIERGERALAKLEPTED